MKHLLTMVLVLFSIQANASRLTEIEDYYTNKASDYIKARYPRKAFSVYVKVDAEDKPAARKPSALDGGANINLPYFKSIQGHQIDFWDRKDVSMGTLISYLKSVYVKVDIDGDFTETEKQDFHKELFQNLKLSEIYDRLEVNQKEWQAKGLTPTNRSYLVFGAAGLTAVALLFVGLFIFGIRSLVRGLSQPLADLSKSAENVANSSSWKGDFASTSGFQLNQQKSMEMDLSTEQFAWVKGETKRLSSFLAEPSAELIQKIEEKGAENPFAMGALFSEMDTKDLMSLVQWARGDWWRVAITQKSPLTKKSLEFINDIAHLQIRQSLTGQKKLMEASELRFEQILARLSIKQFGALFENYKFEQAEPLLRCLPKATMIAVGKYLYPGQWAELLAEKNKKIDLKIRNQMEAKALQICPLKTESELNSYFIDSDLIQFLEAATTKDEREVYRTMANSSWIKQERVPFFTVFEGSNEHLQRLTTEIPLDAWSVALTSCDRGECDKIYQFFNAKQRFLLRENKTRFQTKAPSTRDVVESKKRIINAFLSIKNQEPTVEAKDAVNETAA